MAFEIASVSSLQFARDAQATLASVSSSAGSGRIQSVNSGLPDTLVPSRTSGRVILNIKQATTAVANEAPIEDEDSSIPTYNHAHRMMVPTSVVRIVGYPDGLNVFKRKGLGGCLSSQSVFLCIRDELGGPV